MKEEWKDINGYEGRYAVSNKGEVMSLINNRLLSLTKNHHGYYKVALRKNGKSKNFFVSRLVAQAFLECNDSSLQVDHINGHRTDNRVENLRWCTPKENSNFPIAIRHRRLSHGYRIAQYTKEGVFVQYWRNANHVERELDIQKTHINSCCKGRKDYKTAGGYRWEYA